jgi:hypothetical protein
MTRQPKRLSRPKPKSFNKPNKPSNRSGKEGLRSLSISIPTYSTRKKS